MHLHQEIFRPANFHFDKWPRCSKSQVRDEVGQLWGQGGSTFISLQLKCLSDRSVSQRGAFPAAHWPLQPLCEWQQPTEATGWHIWQSVVAGRSAQVRAEREAVALHSQCGMCSPRRQEHFHPTGLECWGQLGSQSQSCLHCITDGSCVIRHGVLPSLDTMTSFPSLAQ